MANTAGKIVTKITPKSIGAEASQGRKGKTHLYRVYGVADGVKATDKDGQLLFGLTGDFRALLPEEPETLISSGVLYLPGGINEMLVSAVDTGELDGNDRPVFASVKFAFDIYTKPSSNPAGYEYEAVPLVDAVENDAMAELAGSLPALAAPKKIKG